MSNFENSHKNHVLSYYSKIYLTKYIHHDTTKYTTQKLNEKALL